MPVGTAGHCRPYSPEGRGKLERWHRTLREQFLAELDATHIRALAGLSARLWAWGEQVYRRSKHSAPGEYASHALPAGPARIRALGALATQLDELACHRGARDVPRWHRIFQSRCVELPYELAGEIMLLLVGAHAAAVRASRAKLASHWTQLRTSHATRGKNRQLMYRGSVRT
ncbi:hypothetical protein [Paraburkholderia caffeinilytica]|uniref:hypothetical protein n=1 Tax=Paraburkholderia caffeinilytica TaxID=1761016 RepID=UPI003DA18316